ncbi:hypothetical protein ACFQU1_11130 [Chelatococcus sp. GCM10030263]|uniref:hypothetical protein n=1 Tax=Chelatococcus sp. GCM10030263 TaxID=3273387 RepID=UPI00360C79B5
MDEGRLYHNHFDEARAAVAPAEPLPSMWLNQSVTNLSAFRYEDFRLLPTPRSRLRSLSDAAHLRMSIHVAVA